MRRKVLPLALVTLCALALNSCDEGTPVAPEGTILRISANPTRIAKTGTSNITLQALRSTGNPVNPGTEIRLATNIGQIEPVVYTDDDGVARGTLRGDGRVGVATISAYSGGIDPVETEVEVGARAAAITLSVDPTNIPETGGSVDLLALVRDDEGQPLPGATVNFRTEAGSLRSNGRFITTNSRGQATDILDISAADVQSQPDRRITVTVESGGESGVVSDTADIVIQGPPVASFNFSIGGTNGTIVSFTDTSTGDPVSWRWDVDNDGDVDYQQQNPVHDYSNLGPGDYIVTLTVSNAFGTSTATRLVTIQ
jgi:hypothetical protein